MQLHPTCPLDSLRLLRLSRLVSPLRLRLENRLTNRLRILFRPGCLLTLQLLQLVYLPSAQRPQLDHQPTLQPLQLDHQPLPPLLQLDSQHIILQESRLLVLYPRRILHWHQHYQQRTFSSETPCPSLLPPSLHLSSPFTSTL